MSPAIAANEAARSEVREVMDAGGREMKSRRRADAAVRWDFRRVSRFGEYGEVVVVIAAVTLVGWLVPLTYHTFGLIYLLVVIALSLRVGRWPVLAAAIVSAVAWNYVFMPPRLSFSVLDVDDGLMLGTYLVVALVAGQLTARIRAQERHERQRERRATALFQLGRTLAEAHTLDAAVAAALRQVDSLFDAQTAVLLSDAQGVLVVHPASSCVLSEGERGVAAWVQEHRRAAGRFTTIVPAAGTLHLPLVRAAHAFGVLVVRLRAEVMELPPVQRDLAEGFAAQIALLLEREQLRAASEREKLFAESDRLHRTLLDSVSHELKTPLAVLRSAGAKLDTADAAKRAGLAAEVRLATSRLDHLVANLLNQTRLESGGLRPQLDWCEASDVIHLARRAVGEALAGRPFELRIPDDLPLFRADAPLLEQALANLLLNAARHTPAGRPIAVSAGLERREGRAWVFMRVDDGGPGLPREGRERLFQKFHRARGTGAGGLGLGLSIVRGFMLAQGGDVTAGDNPGGGARFTVYLPHAAHGQVPNDER